MNLKNEFSLIECYNSHAKLKEELEALKKRFDL